MKQKRTTVKKAGRKHTASHSAVQRKAGTAHMEKENREHKDSVFVDLFYTDVTAEENLLSLCNALQGTHYRSTAKIHKIRIDDILYKNFKNDISFEAGGKVIVFGEHQSTVNRNMPLRCLMYSGRAYEQLVEKKIRYQRQTVKIPTPEFYTFYNGRDNYPLEEELFLSDAFLGPAGEAPLELKVKVININIDKGHSILEKCRVLKEYSLFVDTVRKYEKEEDSIKKAIRECIANGILEDYLKRKGSEVSNMLIAEYDYEEDMRVNREEAREEGREEGREEEAEKYSRLILRLTEDGKNDMIMKIAENPAFREKLYKEYNI